MEIFNPNITGSVTLNGDTITTWPTGSGGGSVITNTVQFEFSASQLTVDFSNVVDLTMYGSYYLVYLTGTGNGTTTIQQTALPAVFTNYDNWRSVSYFGAAYSGISGSYTFPALEYIGTYAFYTSTNITNYGSRGITEFNAPKAKKLGYGALGYQSLMVSASLGTDTTLEYLGPNALQNCSSLTYVDISTISGSDALGGQAASNNVFINVASGGTIYVPSFYETNNAGSPDGDIVYLRDTKGWTINYV